MPRELVYRQRERRQLEALQPEIKGLNHYLVPMGFLQDRILEGTQMFLDKITRLAIPIRFLILLR